MFQWILITVNVLPAEGELHPTADKNEVVPMCFSLSLSLSLVYAQLGWWMGVDWKKVILGRQMKLVIKCGVSPLWVLIG